MHTLLDQCNPFLIVLRTLVFHVILRLQFNCVLLSPTLFMCTGATSPHWIDRANLNDMLSRERDSPESKPQNIWSISTQTFEQNHQVQHAPSQSTSAMTINPVDIPSTSSPPQSPTSPGGRGGTTQNGTVSSFGVAVENRSRVVGGGGERTTSTGASSPTAVAGSSSGLPGSVKPNRTAPPPPKARKKSKGRGDTVESDQEPTPYVYPMQKLMQRLKQHRETQRERDPGATAQTGGNQSHEYAQPHGHLHMMQQHDGIKHTSVTSSNSKKEKYQPINPKLKQPVGQYQDLLVNNLPRGQSLPAMSTFATLS